MKPDATTPPAASAVPSTTVEVVSDARIARLTFRKDALLNELLHAPQDTPEVRWRHAMEEFAEVVADLATLKQRRKAEPITPYALTLDEHASRLVRSIMQDDPTLTVEDVVNGAVYFNADDDHEGSPECFEAARDARLGKRGN